MYRPPGFTEEKMQWHGLKALAGILADYFCLFVKRRAYTVQPTGHTQKVPGITTTGPKTRKPARDAA
jgi:hypothetical protein